MFDDFHHPGLRWLDDAERAVALHRDLMGHPFAKDGTCHDSDGQPYPCCRVCGMSFAAMMRAAATQIPRP